MTDKRLMRSIYVFCAVLLGGCAFGGSVDNDPLPDPQRLASRIEKFTQAIANDDWQTRYDLSSPMIRGTSTLDEYKRGFRTDPQRLRWEMHGRLVEKCSCRQTRFLSCVLLTETEVTKPGQAPITERVLQIWEYDDTDWYWAYLAPGHRCPPK